MSAPYFLGLDASTQSLKASLLSVNLDVVSECSIHFDSDLPHYGTKGGVIFGQDGEVYSPVLMIVEAMDKLFEKIKSRGWDVKEIRGVAAAGQQHASVYWSKSSSKILASSDPASPLLPQFSNAFSRSIVPNWQDSSTTRECNALEDAVGGAKALAHITGSKAHERFTGAQIMRFRRIDSAGYEATDRISLVSSAITTLLCLDGEVKGIDESDVCGMNLWTMNKRERGWSQVLLEAIAGSEGAAELARKLGRVETDGGRPVGHVGSWYVQRYGFSPECLVFPGTGDNPATFLSLTLRESEGLISLGTSDVVLVSTHKYHPHPDFHAFYHPAQIAPLSVQDTDKREGAEPLRYFNMLVYKNGSLTREHVRDLYFNKSWDAFNAAVEALRPVSKDDLPYQAAFWWLLPDIVPHGAHGVYKYVTDPSAGPFFEAATAKRVQDFSDPRKEAISILESQLLNYRSRSSSILDDQTDLSIPSTANIDISIPRLTRVYATGGASANRTILSMIADVLNTQVCKNVEYLDGKWQDAQWNSCSVGVAYKARWGWERTRNESRKWVGFDQVIKECRLARRKLRGGEGERSDLAEEGIRIIASPTEGARAFERRVEWWRELEKKALNDQRSQAV
uniref:Xylulose kinase n=1 Tax=Kwoniella pini CBS 10737 TaxID=1296096 RepID=A0A1B9HT90_9TREE|nr:xylulokinase [Kwoniella pini CBS 10737]OCF46485.1 xylulokinase [Kwoniella pini CBS 10737]